MATVGIRHLQLYDKVPGAVNFNLGRPKDGFDGTTYSQCVTTEVYKRGTKVAVYTDASEWKGWSVLVYGQFHEGTDNSNLPGEISTGYGICAHAEITTTDDGSAAGPYIFTNDITNSDMTKGGSIVFPVTDISTDEYGWFWCGGVCPVSDITKWASAVIDASCPTAKGKKVCVIDDATGGSTLVPAEATVLSDNSYWTGNINMACGQLIVASA